MGTALSDVAIEQDYLASIIQGGEQWLPRFQLGPEAFSDVRHAVINAACLVAFEANGLTEYLSVYETLFKSNKLGGAGGEEYLLDISARSGVSAPSAHRRLTELAMARATDKVLREAIDKNNHLDTLGAIEHTRSAFDTFNHSSVRHENLDAGISRRCAQLLSGDKGTIVPVGIDAIDGFIGGLSPKSLAIIAADTGVGKSSIAFMMLCRQEERGVRAGYISCEDPDDLVADRFISRRARISATRLRLGGLDAEERATVQRVADTCGVSKIELAYEIGSTDTEVIQSMHTLVRDGGCQCLFVDYLQTINPARASSVRREDIRLIASSIKRTAARLNVPVVLISQIARPADGQIKPTKHSIKESGDVENMAELILGLWCDPSDNSVVLGEVLKSKYGGAGRGFAMRRVNGYLEEIL